MPGDQDRENISYPLAFASIDENLVEKESGGWAGVFYSQVIVTSSASGTA
jgi:hypothetical protein